MVSGHDHTEQGQYQAIIENKVPETPQGSKSPLDEPPPLPPKRKCVVAPSEKQTQDNSNIYEEMT